MPLDHLLVIILVIAAPSIREKEASEGVPSEISTMRVHLSSRVIGLEVYLCLVDKPDDLDVVGGLHELNALESPTGDKTTSMARLGTPRDGLVFGFTDGGGAIRRTPDTEI